MLEAPAHIGARIGEEKAIVHDVESLDAVIKDKMIDVMVIAVPAKAAQRVLNQIMSAGIKAVLNFAPVSLTPRRGVKVKTVDLTTSLESLSYFLARPASNPVTHSRRESSDDNSAERREQQVQDETRR